MNCGALPDHLFENELFGHAKGAFTDASSAATGLVAEAEGGTLFLDEIDTLSSAAQIKLLRFLASVTTVRWVSCRIASRTSSSQTKTRRSGCSCGCCLLIATGADYRQLTAEGCKRFEGRGVYYAAILNETPLCWGAEVVVVGSGNSARQGAVFLAGHTRKVYLLMRSDDLYKNMSSYLAQRIEQTANIEVLFNTTVRRMSGDSHLGSVEIVNSKTGAVRTLETPALFSFIGAVPRTDWLPPEIERDAKKFVRTGAALAQSPHWTARRQPFLLETSRPGVFAAGDVRSDSVKRVASAVGEGAMAVQFVHEYCKAR